MPSSTTRFANLTANDLMTEEPAVIGEKMSLRAAARLLTRDRISGAPVVDDHGRCIGVISATDIVRWAQHAEVTVALGAQESCFHDWQLLDCEQLPAEEVGRFMTTEPIVAHRQTSVVELARTMRDHRIHRLIIVDEARCPIGVVSSMDMLAAVAGLTDHAGAEEAALHP